MHAQHVRHTLKNDQMQTQVQNAHFLAGMGLHISTEQMRGGGG